MSDTPFDLSKLTVVGEGENVCIDGVCAIPEPHDDHAQLSKPPAE